jgi:hypothetical protein
MADNSIIVISTKKWPMKQHEHRLDVEFGLKMSFSTQSLTKR